MTKSTETTPTKFQVGDIVSYNEKNASSWNGGKGEVVGFLDPSCKYSVRVKLLELPPALGEDSTYYIGTSTNHRPEDLLPWEEKAEEKPAEEDVVNSPKHYTQYPVEVIELTRHMPFCDGNVVKYVARSPFKGNRLQDLKKARWYLDDAIAEEEKKQENAQ